MKFPQVIDPKFAFEDFCRLNLSFDNPDLKEINVGDSTVLGNYVDHVILSHQAKAAYGGYLERRRIYQRSDYFAPNAHPKDERNIHLGIDFWAPAGKSVHAGFDGTIHSFNNNTNHGDYGPCIVLEHDGFYTLYGHLTLESLEGLKKGQFIKAGEAFASTGTAEVNGDYPPHLHYQIIKDMGDFQGDYPGVCSGADLDFYMKNCPDPLLF